MVKHSGTKLAGTFNLFRPFRAMVIGDFFLDSYTTGRVKRISPEAPVPVMEVLKQEVRPGGAGNVVLNLSAIGGQVCAVGRVGDDRAGEELQSSLKVSGVNIAGLWIEANYKTPVKNRLIAESQQLLRVDHETIVPLSPQVEEQIIQQIARLIPEMEVIAVSDYGKGFLTPTVISETIRIARKVNVPIIVDPKGTEFSKYKGANILKPNLSEAYAAAKLGSSASLDAVAKQILDLTGVDLLLITRSEAGMSLFHRSGTRNDFPVQSKEVIDVTGAGDTVLALICLGIATQIDIEIGAQLANIAAGIAIERLGCVQVTLPDLAHRLLEYDCETKIFDESHAYALEQVLAKKKYSLLLLEPGQNVFEIIRILKQIADEELVVFLSDPHPSEELIHLLSSMREIDYILLQRLHRFCETLKPEQIYTIKDGSLIVAQPRQISFV